MSKKERAALPVQTRPRKKGPLSSVTGICDPVKLKEIMEASRLSRTDLIILAREEFPLLDKSTLTKGMNPDKYGVVLHPRILELMLSGQEPQPQRPASQRELILTHLEQFGSITSLEAVQLYGIMRLASRVSELRKDGHDIETTVEEGRNRFGVSTAYARYILHKGGRRDV